MPVTLQTPLIEHTANGVVVDFVYNFHIINTDELSVYLDGVKQSSGYTVLNTEPTGGTVTFSVAPTNGTTVRLQRETILNRVADYTDGDALREEVLDSDFDRIVHMIQDNTSVSAVFDVDNNVDIDGGYVQNVADPVNAQDAATKAYVDSEITDFGNELTAADIPIVDVGGKILATDVENALAELATKRAALQASVTTHTDNGAIHFEQSAISITESQISDLQGYALSNHSHAGYFTDAPSNGNTYGRNNNTWVEVIGGGSSDHTELDNIGVNTHAQIDTHIADSTTHFTQASISITESQISDLGSYALATHNHTGVYEPADITILKDADIGVTVQGYNANTALLADIGYEQLNTNGDVGTGAEQVAAGNHTHEIYALTEHNHSGTYSVVGHTHTTSDITDLASYTGLDVRYYTETETDDLLVGKQTKENGFDNRTDSTLSFTDGTRTFEIAPAVTSFTFYSGGNKYTKSSADSVVITDTEGLWFFYYNDSGVLTATQTFSDAIITDYALVALVYWDATNNTAITLAEERHGNVMDSLTHLYNHNTIGTRYGSGLQVGDVVADGSGDLATHAQISVGGGVIWDEDIKITISADTAPANIPILYRSGANGDWRKIAATDYIATTTGTGRAAWNEYTGSTWQLSEVTNNDCVLMHLYASNDVNDGYFLVVGQTDYATLNAARQGASGELLSLATDGLPVVEYKSVATFIVQTSNVYSNAVKSRIRTTDEGEDWIDWRFIDVGAVVNVAGATAQAIDNITDVTITSPADNELLAYDNTSATWINQTATEAGLVPVAGGTFTGNVKVTGDTFEVESAGGADIIIDSNGSTTLSFYNGTTLNGSVDWGQWIGAIGLLNASGEGLLVYGDGTLYVSETDYETLLAFDDDIPNKKYVDDEIAAHEHELDELSATAITDGYVLTAQGDNSAAWEDAAKDYASFYLGTGGLTAIGATAVTLVINNTQINSDGSVFSLATNEVTVSKTADFQITADAYINNSSTARTEWSLYLEVDTGTGYSEVSGTRTGIYERGYDSGSTGSFTTILSVTTGDKFRLRLVRTDGTATTGYQDDNGTRLSFIEMG